MEDKKAIQKIVDQCKEIQEKLPYFKARFYTAENLFKQDSFLTKQEFYTTTYFNYREAFDEFSKEYHELVKRDFDFEFAVVDLVKDKLSQKINNTLSDRGMITFDDEDGSDHITLSDKTSRTLDLKLGYFDVKTNNGAFKLNVYKKDMDSLDEEREIDLPFTYHKKSAESTELESIFKSFSQAIDLEKIIPNEMAAVEKSLKDYKSFYAKRTSFYYDHIFPHLYTTKVCDYLQDYFTAELGEGYEVLPPWTSGSPEGKVKYFNITLNFDSQMSHISTHEYKDGEYHEGVYYVIQIITADDRMLFMPFSKKGSYNSENWKHIESVRDHMSTKLKTINFSNKLKTQMDLLNAVPFERIQKNFPILRQKHGLVKKGVEGK